MRRLLSPGMLTEELFVVFGRVAEDETTLEVEEDTPEQI